MFDQLFIPVIERLHGKKLATLLGEKIGSERTARNYLNGVTRPVASRVNTLKEQSRCDLIECLGRRGWPAAELNSLVEGISAAPGLLSGTIFCLSAENGYIYEDAFALSVKIDEISKHLAELRSTNQIVGIVKLLLESELIAPEHLIDPEVDGPNSDLRRVLEDASSFQELIRPIAVIGVNLQMQLLATLDLEFCTKYLKQYSLRPVFLSLMPRLDPAARIIEDGHYIARKDIVHLPVRRLLELMACLRVQRVNGRWPTSVPSVGEMAAWMQCDPRALTKWRMGRRFSFRDYEILWTALFSLSDCPPPAPGAPAFAAALLTHLCIKGQRETKNLTAIVPDDEIYERWWRYQRDALTARHGSLSCGDAAWMPALF